MRPIALLLAVAFTLPAHSNADTKSAGIDPVALEAAAQHVASFVENDQLAGALFAVSHRGETVLWHKKGFADAEAKRPVADDSIFRIYSMTKPIIGAALMVLFDEGKFALDDPVAKYLPELADLRVATGPAGEDGVIPTEPAKSAMTIRQLLTHTAGFTYGLFSSGPVDMAYRQADVLANDQTLEQFMTRLAAIPLAYQPGTQWQYSVSVDVQGRLVEVLSGMKLSAFLSERLFEPLGMVDTAFWVPAAKADRLAALYATRNGQRMRLPNGDAVLKEQAFESGGGGLVSTASDYLRFGQMLVNGGELDGQRVIETDTVEMMFENHLPAAVPAIHPMVGNPGNTFGLGGAIVADPNEQIEHARAVGELWWYGIGGTWMGIHREEELVIVGMIQSMGGGAARAARLDSKRMVYEALH